MNKNDAKIQMTYCAQKQIGCVRAEKNYYVQQRKNKYEKNKEQIQKCM